MEECFHKEIHNDSTELKTMPPRPCGFLKPLNQKVNKEVLAGVTDHGH